MQHRTRRGVVVLVTAGVVAPALVAAGETTEPDVAARPLFRFEDDRIAESSGLATSSDGQLLYTLQDAGKPSTLFAVDLSGQTRATISVPGVENMDWEDVDRGEDPSGRPALFVGDLGDAFFVRRGTGAPPRTDFSVIRLTEPEVGLEGPTQVVAAADVVVFDVVYEDGAARNAESLAVQPGTDRVFVVDKVEDDRTTARVWAAPEELSTDGPNVLAPLAQVPVTEATAAAFSPDGRFFAVRDYRYAYLWEVLDDDVAVALRERPVRVPLPSQRQGEGMTFGPDGDELLISSEGANTLVWSVPLPRDLVAPREATAPVAQTGGASPLPTGALVAVGAAGAGLLALAALELRAARRRRRG